MDAIARGPIRFSLPVHPTPRRIAIVHDWLDTWGGGEQCLAQMLAVFPDATLFSLVDFLPDDLRARIGGRRARTSFLQSLPGARTRFRSFLPLFPRAVESLDLADFDLVLSSSHAVAKGAPSRPGQLHVCYCYSPMRYAWDLREEYLRQVGLDRGLRGFAVRRALDRLQLWDRASSARVDRFVAISRYIAARIRRCYDRDADVIYPPVALPSALPDVPRAGSYVTVSRFVPYKRIDLIAAAFRLLPDRELVVIGDGPEHDRIAAAAGPNVRLLGALPDDERDRWLAGSRAFLFAADEDFGIAPVEAQAYGTPVIAYGAGGALETIRGLDDPAPTGVFFAEQSPDAIARAVRQFESAADRISPQACRGNAERFAPERFRREFGTLVEREWLRHADQRAA
jgi:glycosyltransferase involved in cell wall biosynthesis